MTAKKTTIIKDYWDLKSSRVQVTTGLFIASVLIIALWLAGDQDFTGSISHQSNISLINVYDSHQKTIFGDILSAVEFSYFTLPRLLIHIATSVFVGLVALEISKIYGKRWGSMHTVWASLLYAVCPTTIILIYAGDGLAILFAQFFSTLAVYFDFRYRYLEEEFYLLACAILLTFSVSCDVVSGLTGLAGILTARILLKKLRRKRLSNFVKFSWIALVIPILFIVSQKGGLRVGLFSVDTISAFFAALPNSPEHILAYTKFTALACLITFAVYSTLVTMRIMAGTLFLRPLFFLCLWISISFLVAAFYTGNTSYLADSSVIISSIVFYCSMPVVILISLTALPTIDAVNKKISMIICVIGCLSLSMIFVFWGREMYKVESKQVSVQRDFREFRSIAQSEANSYQKKNLYLVGMPESIRVYVDKHKMSLSPEREKNIYESVRSLRRKGLSMVNILTNTASGIQSDKPTIFLRWNDQKNTFVPFKHEGRYNFTLVASELARNHLAFDPPTTPVLSRDSFGLVDINLTFAEVDDKSIKINISEKPLVMWLPDTRLNPYMCKTFMLKGSLPKVAFKKDLATRMKLAWVMEDSKIAEQRLYARDKNTIIANLADNPQWLRNASITKVGIIFEPANYSIAIDKVQFGHDQTDIPLKRGQIDEP